MDESNLVHRTASLHRTSEGHVSDTRVANGLRRDVVGAQHRGHEMLGQTGLLERADERRSRRRRSLRVLEHDGVAGENGREHGVGGREQRVVPRRQHERHADRLLLDRAHDGAVRERRQLIVGERLGSHGDHGAQTLQRAGDLTGRLRQGLAHLPRDIGGDRELVVVEDLHEARAHLDALRQRNVAPFALLHTRTHARW